MPQRITRFSIAQTAKVMGILYAIGGLIFVPIFYIVGLASPEARSFGLGFALLMPIAYGIFGFIFVAIACLVYNWVAGWAGGIEVELGEAPRA